MSPEIHVIRVPCRDPCPRFECRRRSTSTGIHVIPSPFWPKSLSTEIHLIRDPSRPRSISTEIHSIRDSFHSRSILTESHYIWGPFRPCSIPFKIHVFQDPMSLEIHFDQDPCHPMWGISLGILFLMLWNGSLQAINYYTCLFYRMWVRSSFADIWWT